MMTSPKSVLLIGPGFLGLNVLDNLIHAGYPVTVMVRRESQAAELRSSSTTVVLGNLEDSTLITKLASTHDITINTASADHLPSVQAILAGSRIRAREEKQSIYIHTSGTNITADGADGAFKSERVFHDSHRKEIDAVGPDAPHRDVDTTIAAAAQEDNLKKWAKIAIMIPPTIYGSNSKHKRISIQWPFMVRFALKHGYTGFVGEGKSVESQIHVLDAARALTVLLNFAERAPAEELLQNPYFFCENGVETSWKEVAAEIGKILFERGKIEDPTPRTIPKELYGDLFGEETPVMIGLNSRSRAVRLRDLGWRPEAKGWRESLSEDEVPSILAE